MNSIHYLDSLVVYTDAIRCICTQWDATYFLASINTNFSRKLNLIDSCHITCHTLASQQVNIGLIPCSHLLYDRGSRRLTQWWPICTTCLAAQLQLRLWLSPPSQQPTLAVSYWKYAPVGYIPAHISADPAVSGQQGLHWHFPHTHLPDADHKLGQIGSGCWLSIHTWTQVSLRHNNTSHSALVMGEVFPSMAAFHSPVAVSITPPILGDP